MGQPTTLVRLGWFFGDANALELAVKKYHRDITKVPVGIATKFALWEESQNQYFLMVSHDPSYSPPKSTYNLALSITSEDAVLNERVLAEFSSAVPSITGLHEPRSQFLRSNYEMMSITYPVFKKLGKQAIDLLKRM